MRQLDYEETLAGEELQRLGWRDGRHHGSYFTGLTDDEGFHEKIRLAMKFYGGDIDES